MLSVGLVKVSPVCGPSIDPCLMRLVNSAEFEFDSMVSGSDNAAAEADCESASYRNGCSDEESGARHGIHRNGLTPWKSDIKIYSPGVKGYRIFF